MQLETERLLLRPITLEDNAYILAQLNDPDWIKNIGDRNIHSLEEAKTYIEKKILSYIEKSGEQTFFVVIRKEDPTRKIIGQCGIFHREGLEIKDLGFAFLGEYCGKGYGTEAAIAVKDLAFKEYNYEKLAAITTEDNVPSRKLLENLGFQYIKMIELPNIEGLSTYYEL